VGEGERRSARRSRSQSRYAVLLCRFQAAVTGQWALVVHQRLRQWGHLLMVRLVLGEGARPGDGRLLGPSPLQGAHAVST